MYRLATVFLGIMTIGMSACEQDSERSSSNEYPQNTLEKNTQEGRRLADLTFDTVDEDTDGQIDFGEMEKFRRSVFISQDANEDGQINQDEFLSWGYGYHTLADELDRRRSYDVAMKLVHNLRDRNGDGQISKTEHRLAMISDFRRADDDNNAVLTRPEFTQGYSILTAIRIALKDK